MAAHFSICFSPGLVIGESGGIANQPSIRVPTNLFSLGLSWLQVL